MAPRAILLLVFLSLPILFGQTGDPEDGGVAMNAIAEYLQLSPAQRTAIYRNWLAHRQLETELIPEINRLNDEIGVETQESSPSAGLLGLHYSRIEDLCRAHETPRQDLHRRQLQILSEQQRGRLQALVDYPLNSDLYDEALFRFLLPLPPPDPRQHRPFNGTVFLARFLNDIIPRMSPYMASSLQLTPGQIEALEIRLSQYAGVFRSQWGRMGQVTLEIEEELAKPSPQPVAIGDSYRELESIRRSLAAREDRLRRDNLEILTPNQRQRLSGLQQLSSLGEAHYTATALLLLPPSTALPASRESSASGYSGPVLVPVGARWVPWPAGTIYRSCRGIEDYRAPEPEPNQVPGRALSRR